MALAVGSRLGHYDVTALIGEGGMGKVYQATDTKLRRQLRSNVGQRTNGEYGEGYASRSVLTTRSSPPVCAQEVDEVRSCCE